MAAPDTLEQLVMSRRVIVAVGAGGVGKTTTAAALGLAAAARGRRVLCLTIDPAQRLAEALGLERVSSEEQAIDPARFTRAGLAVKGSLVAMMLDTKRTFDELILKYASSPERARRLLDNRLYRYISTSLAGTQEYMAMEKLVAVQSDPRFDLIVLDTPPTTNALDFLDAPSRLVDALDSSAMRWIIQAFQSTGKVSFNLVARSAAAVLRGIARVTGAGFLESMAEFLSELNDLFGGFKERARSVEATLRSPEVAFVLVTTPAPMSVQEVLFFADRLREASMPQGAFVVNRFHLPPAFADAPPTTAEVARGLGSHRLALDDDAPERVLRAHADAARLAALDTRNVERLRERWSSAPIVRVPELAADVRDLRSLAAVSETLMRGGVEA
jgi:anion-transporting  ArsA/GET3 family ATPase